MKSEDVILGVIREKSRTGYEIVEVFKTIFSHFFDGSYGSVYPVLHKLEKEGKITKETIVQEGKPNKNVYSITEMGREHFKNYLESDLQAEVTKSDFLMRLYFGEFLSQAALHEWIEEELSQKKRLLNQLEENYAHWMDNMSPSQKLCYEIGIARYQSELKILTDRLS
ncbi:MAG: PadR family transcriptional regulator [Sporolactobacillus sp.]